MEQGQDGAAGSPTFVAEVPGPLHSAALVFGVGMIDEPLHRRGITHMIEHLTLSDLPPSDVDANGYVTAEHTVFSAIGTAADVARHLNMVIARLGGVSTRRLDHERRVLIAESEGRSTSAVQLMLSNRFGALGHGACAHPELGLATLGPVELQAWAAEHFVSARAALVVSGPDPAAVTSALKQQLPAGAPLVRTPVRQVRRSPGQIRAKVAGPALGVTGAPTTELAVGIEMLRESVELNTRHELGLTYGVAAIATRLDASSTHWHIGLDALGGHEEEVTLAMYRCVNGFFRSDLDRRPFDRIRRRALLSLDSPGQEHHELMGRAIAHVAGWPFRDREQLRADYEALSTAAVEEALRGVLPTVLWMTPASVGPLGGLEDVTWTETAADRADLDGAALRFVGRGDDRARIIVGTSAIALVSSAGRRTVRFDECIALLAWDDGTREALRADGSGLRIRPWEWRRGDTAIAALDAGVPAELHVPMGGGSGPPPRPRSSKRRLLRRT